MSNMGGFFCFNNRVVDKTNGMTFSSTTTLKFMYVFKVTKYIYPYVHVPDIFLAHYYRKI